MLTRSRLLPIPFLLSALLPASVAGQATASRSAAEWPAYGLDPEGSRFSPLTDITPANVGSLRTVSYTHLTLPTIYSV